MQIGFAEVRNHIPVVVIQQREDRFQGGCILSDGGFQGDNHAVKRRANFGELQVQFRQGDLRDDPGALRDHRIDAGDRGISLFSLQQRSFQFGAGGFFRGTRLIEIFLRGESLRHQRFQADTGRGSLFHQRLRPLYRGAHRLSVILLGFDGALGQHNLRIKRRQP